MLDIKIKGIEFENKNMYEAIVDSFHNIYLPALIKDIDISCLAFISFTDTLSKDIHDFQTFHGIAITGLTDDNHGVAWGKSIQYGDNYAIFIKIEALKVIINQNSTNEQKLFIINLIHHELCHIHDFQQNARIIESIKSRGNGHDLYTAINLWQEYIANRLSAYSLPHSTNYSLEAILDNYKSISGDIKQAIDTYRSNGDASNLYNEVHITFGQHFIFSCCYSFGFLDELVKDRGKISTLMAEYLGDIDISFIEPIHDELILLFNKYPNWQSKTELIGLSDAYYNSWEMIGINVIQGDNGFYIGLL